MSDKPLISIVILNCNRLPDLKETIIRTKDITYENIEIIVVDNGSNDGSDDYIRSLDDKFYKKIMLNYNSGSAHGHNVGMKLARGKYIITIDDDCFLQPNCIDVIVDYFEEYPKLAGIGCGFVNPYKGFDNDLYWEKPKINYTALEISNSYETFVYTSAAAWRKSALDEIDYIDENWFYVTEDIELCFGLIANGNNTKVFNELIAFHKSSPLNRDFSVIDYNGIEGNVMLIAKYYPIYMIPAKLFNILNKALLYSIINKKLLYLKAFFGGLFKSIKLLKYENRLTYTLTKNASLTPLNILFQR